MGSILCSFSIPSAPNNGKEDKYCHKSDYADTGKGRGLRRSYVVRSLSLKESPQILHLGLGDILCRENWTHCWASASVYPCGTEEGVLGLINIRLRKVRAKAPAVQCANSGAVTRHACWTCIGKSRLPCEQSPADICIASFYWGCFCNSLRLRH